ncbi:Sialic acid transporter (permease) NanT [Minicystis rosea]|nr:Sialic acid transporter (permease) NanT [Minicystis rosea]
MARPFPTRLFLFAFLGWAFDFYDLVLIGFVKEPVGHTFGLTAAKEAWMLGVALGTSGLGGILGGMLADRIGKRDVLAATVLLYSLGSLIAGLAPVFPLFLLGRGLVGLGVGGEWAIGHGMLAEAVEPSYRGRASSFLQAGEPVGVALAAIAGYLLVPLVGWRWVMIGSSATALLAFAMRSSIHLPSTPAPRRPSIRHLLGLGIGGRMARAWVLGVLKLGTYWTCYTWLPSFLLHQMHQGIGRSLTWVITAQTGQLLGMLTFGQVSDRIGRRPAFCAYSLLTALAIAPLAFAWQTLSAHPILFWATMATLGFGSGCTAGFGALLAELFPDEVRGAAMGTTYNLARAVQLGAPLLVAYAVSIHGLAGGLSVPLLLAIGTATWVWVLPETRGITLTAIGSSASANTQREPPRAA